MIGDTSETAFARRRIASAVKEFGRGAEDFISRLSEKLREYYVFRFGQIRSKAVRSAELASLARVEWEDLARVEWEDLARVEWEDLAGFLLLRFDRE